MTDRQQPTSIRLDRDTRALVEQEAHRAGIGTAELIRRAIHWYTAARRAEAGELPPTSADGPVALDGNGS